MNIDVITATLIGRPPDVVAAFAVDPANAPAWYANIASVEWKTEPSLEVGSQVAFVARFLGREISYTYEIVEHVPDERLVMRTAHGAFTMETTHTWSATQDGQTRMTLRNRGIPSGFSKLLRPFMKRAIARANRNDLRALKELLERDAPRAAV